MVEMAHVPFYEAFAFVVTDLMDKWAGNTDSFLVDSTCRCFNHFLSHNTKYIGS